MIAPREVVPIVLNLVKPKSVLDAGCGTGTWLKAFEEVGVIDYIGVDGSHVDRSRLNIPIEKFVAQDLRAHWSLKRKFDLVLSLEVAEHLPEENADLFVETLVNHANENIIFSAAIPGQEGQNHLNEQWPAYWQRKFLRHGFYFHDDIRPLIWSNEKVDWWYRQNIFLLNKRISTSYSPPLIHPDHWIRSIKSRESARSEYIKSLVEGKHGLRVSSAIFFNALLFKLKNLF
jgi:SAM-dependent methyltransferase